MSDTPDPRPSDDEPGTDDVAEKAWDITPPGEPDDEQPDDAPSSLRP